MFRYALVVDYAEQRIWLFPPFSIPYHLYIVGWHFLYALLSCCCHCCPILKNFPEPPKLTSGLKVTKPKEKDLIKKLKEFERCCRIQLMKQKKLVETGTIEYNFAKQMQTSTKIEGTLKEISELLNEVKRKE